MYRAIFFRQLSIQSLLLFVVYFYSTAVVADLTFSAPPRESVENGNLMYAPIAEHLTKILGEKVTYEHPGGWFQYSANMRNGKYDIVFDGPHFAAWRIKHLNHQLVARLPGSLDFMIIVRANDHAVKDIHNLAGRRICGLASPNLGTVTMYSLYLKNPVVQPRVFEIKGGFKGVYEAFKQKKCRAAVVRENIYKKLTDEEKRTLKVIYRSPSLPNQTVTVSERVTKKARALIASNFSKFDGGSSAKELFGRFSKKAKYFIRPEKTEYVNLENLLEGIVWGW